MLKFFKFLNITLIFLICVACSSFDGYMRDGKKYMVDGDYEKAIEHLNLATIENPTNKDAIALLENAKIMLSDQIEKQQKDRFSNTSKDIKKFITEDIITIDVNQISVDEAKDLLPHAELNKEKAASLFEEYDIINKDYSDATKSIKESSDESVVLLENIIENIIEPLPYSDPNSTRRDRLSARLNSNDSRIKASYNLIDIESSLNNFDNVYVKIMRNENSPF